MFDFKGLINLAIYSFLLYYLDSFKQGINLFNYLRGEKKLNNVKKNYDVIINEDTDVSDERVRVMNSDFDVSL